MAVSFCACGVENDEPEATDATVTEAPDEEEETTTEPDETEAPETTEPETTEPEVTTSEVTTTEVTTAAPETEAVTTAATATVAPETEPAIEVTEMSATMYAKSSVNVRQGPGTEYDRVGHLDAAEEVNVTGQCANGWYRIEFEGGEYYVSGNYLQSEKPAAQTIAVTEEETPVQTEPVEEPEEVDSFELAEEFMSTVEIVPECPESYKNSSSNVGQVIKTTYYSTTVGKNRPVNILLPVNYDENKEYPVLYVLHGIYCDQNTMMDSWKTHIIISNMIADGSAEEMIVVFPYMFASKDKDACDGITLENVAAYDNFINALVTALMPFIERNYAAATGKDNTAVFGFSMGGREALAIGFMYPDLFGYIGADAPAPGLVPGQDWALNHPGQLTEDELSYTTEMPYLIMMGAGDSDGTVGSFPKTYHEIMERNGVTHIWYEIPGEDHNSDKAISSVTYNFCRYVFRAK